VITGNVISSINGKILLNIGKSQKVAVGQIYVVFREDKFLTLIGITHVDELTSEAVVIDPEYEGAIPNTKDIVVLN
jgi:hypothetical protein